MPTIYGTQDALEDIRSTISGEMDDLIAAMSSGSVSPALIAVYDNHWGTAALTFPSVSIGLEEVILQHPSGSATQPVGPLTDLHATVALRVMIGNRNVYHDEEKVMQLSQSIVNWMQAHRSTMANDVRLWEPMQIEGIQDFTDTDTVGGVVRFRVRRPDVYGVL